LKAVDSETKKMLEDIFAAVKKLDNRVSKLETGVGVPSGNADGNRPVGKKLSLKEFLIDRAPANAVQTTLAIAYYLEKFDGVSPVNASDLDRAFREAREPVPANINDKTNMCVKNGHLMEAKSKKDNLKAWLVTRTGDQLVNGGFGKTQK
jgi:hypothetical protein